MSLSLVTTVIRIASGRPSLELSEVPNVIEWKLMLSDFSSQLLQFWLVHGFMLDLRNWHLESR